MKTRLVAILVAAVFLALASTALADGNSSGVKASSSVAEMLQKRQESQLREQLVKEARWDEVRKLDEAQARRQQERQQKIVAQMNGQLAASAKGDLTTTSNVGEPCDKETLKVR